jgi:hypothetical protein
MIAALLLALAQVGGSPVPPDAPQNQPEETVVQRIRPLPSIAAGLWVVGGYGWTSQRSTISPVPTTPPVIIRLPGPRSSFGGDVGGDLFFRVAGPVYLGAIIDYGFAGPNAWLLAGGARIVIADLALSGGFGYSSLDQGGPGAIAAADYAITSALGVRIQGSWRHSSFSNTLVTPVDYRRTVWSLMAGLSLHL